MTYLLLIFSIINPQRSAVQALIVVPTRELGMQVRIAFLNLLSESLDLSKVLKDCVFFFFIVVGYEEFVQFLVTDCNV